MTLTLNLLDTPADLACWALNLPATSAKIYLPDVPEPVGQGFEVVVTQTWPPPQPAAGAPGTGISWDERSLVVQNDKLAHRQQHGLAERLRRAEQALAKLKAAPDADLAPLTNQSQALLQRYDVAAYLQVTWTAHTTETKRYLKRGRHGPNSPYELVTNTTWQVQVTRLPEAIANFNQLAGWRIYVTNAPAWNCWGVRGWGEECPGIQSGRLIAGVALRRAASLPDGRCGRVLRRWRCWPSF